MSGLLPTSLTAGPGNKAPGKGGGATSLIRRAGHYGLGVSGTGRACRSPGTKAAESARLNAACPLSRHHGSARAIARTGKGARSNARPSLLRRVAASAMGAL